MSEESKVDQILDLLLDVLSERQAVRQETDVTADEVAVSSDRVMSRSVVTDPDMPIMEPPTAIEDVEEAVEETAVGDTVIASLEETAVSPLDERGTAVEETETPIPSLTSVLASFDEIDEGADGDWFKSPPKLLPTIHLERMLLRLVIALALLIIVINIPFNRHGITLAKAMPDEQALVVRDGLLLKGSGDEVYVLEGNRKRWITSIQAFEYYGYRWEQVHDVEDDFLDDFNNGRPIYLLFKCPTSPHVYAFADGSKSWIKDIKTFQAEGFIWEDVQEVSCTYLRNLPDGTPIPADAGRPPQP